MRGRDQISPLAPSMSSAIMNAPGVGEATTPLASRPGVTGVTTWWWGNLPDKPGSADTFGLPLQGRDLLLGVVAPTSQVGRLSGVEADRGRRVVSRLACAGSKTGVEEPVCWSMTPRAVSSC